MQRPRSRRSPLSLAAATFVAFVALGGSLAWACTIPVFRYALERWESDRFLVIVYHDGQLTEQQESEVKELTQRSSASGGPLNIEVIRCDVKAASPPQVLDVQPPADRPLPWLEVRSRVAVTRTVVHWQGPLAAAVGQSGLFDSPARREIVRRLLAGDSCVFLLVAPEDQLERRAKEVQALLDSVAADLALPQGIGQPGSELYAPIPLGIRFSVLPVPLADPQEQTFFQLLAASAKDWRADTANLIPVFGRCRALDVFSYAEDDQPLLEDLGNFLCGACSCRVKQANPGFDLLVSVNWNQRLFNGAAPDFGPSGLPSSSASLRQADAEYVPIPSGNQPAAAAQPVAGSGPESPAREEPAASSSAPIASSSFHQIQGTTLVVLLLVALALCSGGILAGVIRARR